MPESQEQKIYKVQVQDIFEGPMDLLIYLIKKNQIDIYDIPIGLITEKFLEYLEWMKTMNIDFAGDFLVMAATLTHIKSKTMLPVRQDQEEDEDPRNEIVRPIEEYLKMKEAAELLACRNRMGETFARNIPRDNQQPEEQTVNIGLFELIDALKKILDKLSYNPKVEFNTEKISVRQKIIELTAILEKNNSLTFEELFTSDKTKSAVIVTFLALLEMTKISLLTTIQNTQTGIIRIFYKGN